MKPTTMLRTRFNVVYRLVLRQSERRTALPVCALVVAVGLGVSGCKGKGKDESAAAAAPAAASASAGGGTITFPGATLPPPLPSVAAPADVANPPADAERTPSGVAIKVLEPGTGTKHPDATYLTRISYVGWRKDGTMFDQSPPVGVTFRQLTPGWGEGLERMVEGEKARLWIPAAVAYGDNPKPGQPQGDLTIDVKLVKIDRKIHGAEEPKLTAIPAPGDVAAPPKTAKKTRSGLSYQILTAANGDKPNAKDTVVVQYTGWTRDGKMFDSSVARDLPATFPLDHVIKGWTEGVQLMHVGEKARFWIPANLAYGDKPARADSPAGPLVFDIELVSIKPSPANAASSAAVAGDVKRVSAPAKSEH